MGFGAGRRRRPHPPRSGRTLADASQRSLRVPIGGGGLVAGAALSSGLAAQPRTISLRSPGRAIETALRIDTLWSVGQSQSGSAVAFGSIADVAVDPAKRVFVVDMRLQTVHVVDSSGRPLRTLGRAGDGPGEFRFPSRVTSGPDGHVFVLDQYSGRITEYSPSLELLRSFVLEGRVMIRSMIATTTSLIVSGADPSPRGNPAIIHEFSRDDGRLIRRLGRLRVVNSPALAHQAGAGPLAIAPDGTLWYAVPGPYRLEQYSRAGDLLLVVERPDVVVPPAESGVGVVTSGDRVQLSRKPQDFVSTIRFIGADVLRVQLTRVDGRVQTDDYLIRGSGNGSSVVLTRSWVGFTPLLLAPLEPGVFATTTRDSTYGEEGLALIRVRPE